MIDRVFSEILTKQKPRLCETRNEGQLETAPKGMVDGSSQDGEDSKRVILGNSSLPRSWPVGHLHL